MKPLETIDYHIRYAWLKISKMYNHQAAPYGLTQSTGFILLNIDPKKGTPSTQLGPMMGMEPTSLSRTLKSMAEKGWISKISDENDGRIIRVLLTDEGERLRSIAKKSVVNFNTRIREKIGEKRFNQFREIIEIIDKETLQQQV